MMCGTDIACGAVWESEPNRFLKHIPGTSPTCLRALPTLLALSTRSPVPTCHMLQNSTLGTSLPARALS